ncbi:Polysaccharide pyruvyl transferase [Amycolatopsis xylanica]|uniref:Polysaccharide pyruvyl transferase n=1 Tax=Amycolatopsis xylanica TaxID=589385 RepID=A0A1H3SAR5_9PSEU|nr:polysaccharide pyruvyl transferase family protein [Amycolatopsis xylanica]SDZ34748.1 Polysaccharide pyruvyl transferase [Amycolatopsis xylanica]
MRILLAGWPSFTHGEATAGDVLSMRRVSEALTAAGVEHDLAWSPVFAPGALSIEDADPARYSHVVFVCGPVHGASLLALHERYARCRRIAVGVSVLDVADPAVRGFHRVLARDGVGGARQDLSAVSTVDLVPVIGVVLAPGQREYGGRGRHDRVHEAITTWLLNVDCARLPLDTRLDSQDWRHAATPGQFLSLLSKVDALVTTRLHGLVLGLRCGLPVLAVDPVDGGGKVTAQAGALDWPACVSAEDALSGEKLDGWGSWCLSDAGRALAAAHRMDQAEPLLTELLGELEAG